MEALPFHDHVQNEANGDDDSKEAEDDEAKRKEICDYTPVKINSTWFENKLPATLDEELTLTKYRAHAAYRKQDYNTAISLYERCHELLPANANLLLREIGESKVRCLMKLGNLEECEDLLMKLLDEKGNPQDSSLGSLLSDVYIALGKLEVAATNLRQCISLHPEYADYWVKVADVFEQLAKSSTFFLEHCNVEDKKESNSLSDIWYFVDLLKESFITENFGENEENEQLEHNNEMNLYDYQTNEAFSFVQERLDEEVCVDTIEAVVKKFTDLTVTSNARRENNYHLKTCKYCQIGLTSSSLARLKNNDGDPNSSPFSDDWSLFTSLTSQWDHSQDRRSIIAHYISWHHIMRLTHWFALGKAWQSLRKTVQYSKGFAKDIERRRLSEIEQRMLKSVGSDSIMNWLMKATETSSSGKQLAEY